VVIDLVFCQQFVNRGTAFEHYVAGHGAVGLLIAVTHFVITQNLVLVGGYVLICNFEKMHDCLICDIPRVVALYVGDQPRGRRRGELTAVDQP
jgi:hypothetical protein